MEIWLNKIKVDKDYRISEIELLQINSGYDYSGVFRLDYNRVIMTLNQLHDLFKHNQQLIRNVAEVTSNSITIKQGLYSGPDSWKINEFNDIKFPAHLLLHKQYRNIDDKFIVTQEHTEKLENYMNKLKMLGEDNNFIINKENSTLKVAKSLKKETQMPPVLRVNIVGDSGKAYTNVEGLVFSNETLDIRFPFHKCINVKHIKLGKNTRKALGFKLLNRLEQLETLDLGGCYEIPALSDEKVNIDELVVTTRCEILHNGNNYIYKDNVNIHKIKIVEFIAE